MDRVPPKVMKGTREGRAAMPRERGAGGPSVGRQEASSGGSCTVLSPQLPPARGWQRGQRGQQCRDARHTAHPCPTRAAVCCLPPRVHRSEGGPSQGGWQALRPTRFPSQRLVLISGMSVAVSVGHRQAPQWAWSPAQDGPGTSQPTAPSQINRLKPKADGQIAPHQVGG